MGLFKANEENQDRGLAQTFPPGTPFRLIRAELGVGKGSFGERLMAQITVTAVTEPEHELSFGVWGSLAEQLRELETGELPAIVTLSNSTGLWLFAPHGPEPVIDPETGEAQPQTVSPDAHLELDEAPADSALGAVQERTPPTPPPVDPDGGHVSPVSTDPPSVKPTEIDESQAV